MNTHPKNVFKLKSRLDSIIIYCNSIEEIEDGWLLYGITYGKNDVIPEWHEEPMPLNEDDVDVWFKMVEVMK